MDYLFPCLSPGFIGDQKNDLSLNSEFYSKVISDLTCLDKPDHVLFPQRIQKPDFFQELINLESNTFKNKLSNIKNIMIEKLLFYSKSGRNVELINWANLAIRYALLNEVMSVELADETDDERVELDLIQCIAYLQSSLIVDKIPSSEAFHALFYRIENRNISERLTVGTYNFIVVAAMRFRVKVNPGIVQHCHQGLVSLAANQHDRSIEESLAFSMAYRGLAMLDDIENSVKHKYMDYAEELARSIASDDKPLDCLIKENLFTCLQSQEKWHSYLQNFDKASEYLQELISIDPCDSVAYAANAFFSMSKNDMLDCRRYFEKAYLLGPPGVGMHLYYYAKSSEGQLPVNDIIALYEKAFEFDKESVSPLLELLHWHEKNGEKIKMKSCANILISDDQLYSQLDHDEIAWIKNLRGS